MAPPSRGSGAESSASTHSGSASSTTISPSAVERMIRDARAQSEAVASDVSRKRRTAEQTIQSLQREIDEIRFFDEIDEIGDDSRKTGNGHVTGSSRGTSPTSVAHRQFSGDPYYSSETFGAYANALASAQEANDAFTNKLKLSEKRSGILEQQVQILKLQQKELASENSSLHKFKDLCLQATLAHDKELGLRAVAESECNRIRHEDQRKISKLEDELDRTHRELRETTQILNESVQRVESQECRHLEDERAHRQSMEEMRRSVENARADLTAAADSEEKNLTLIEDLTKSLGDAQDRLSDAQRSHRKEVECLRNDLQASREEANVKSASLLSSNQTIERLEQSLSVGEENHRSSTEKIQKLLDDSEKKICAVLEQNEQKDATIADLERCLSQVESRQVDLESSHEDMLSKLTRELEATFFRLEDSEESLSSTRSQLESLRQKHADLRDEKASSTGKLEATNAQLQASIDNATNSVKERDARIEELQDALGKSEHMVKSAEEKLLDFTDQSNSMTKHMQSIHKEEMGEMLASIKSRERKISSLERSFEAANARVADREELQRRADELKKDLEESLSTSLERSAQISALEMNLDDVTSELNQAKEELAQMHAVQKETTRKLKAAEDENGALKESVAEAKSSIVDLEKSLASASDKLGNMGNLDDSLKKSTKESNEQKKYIAELERFLDDRKGENEDLRSQLLLCNEDITKGEERERDLCNELRTVTDSKSRLEVMVANGEKTISQLRRSLNDATADLSKTDSLLSSTADDRAKLRIDLMQANERVMELASSSDAQMSELRKSLSKASSKIADLSEQHQQTKEALKKSTENEASLGKSLRGSLDSIEEMKMHCSNLENEKSALEVELTTCREQKYELEVKLNEGEDNSRLKADTISKLKTSLKEMDDEISQRQDALAECRVLVAEKEKRLNKVEGELDKLRDLNAHYESLSKERKKAVGEWKASCEEARNDLEQATSLLREMESENADLQQELKETQDRLASAQRKNVRWSNYYNNASPNISRIEAERDDLLKENEELRRDRESMEKSLGRSTLKEEGSSCNHHKIMESRVSSMEEYIKNLEAKNHSLKEERNSLQKSFWNSGRKLKEKENMLATAESRINDVEQKLYQVLKSKEADVDGLKGNMNQMNQDVADKQAEIEALKKEMLSLEQQVYILEEENETLEAERSSLEASLEMCNTSLKEVEKDYKRVIDDVEAQSTEAASSTINRLEQELKLAIRSKDVLLNEIKVLEQERLYLEEDLKNCRLSMTDMEKDYGKKMKDKDAEIAEATAKSARASIDNVAATNAELKTRVENLVEELKVKQDVIDKLKIELQSQATDSSSGIPTKGGEIEKMHASMKIMKGRIDSMTMRNTDLLAELNKVKAKCARLEKSQDGNLAFTDADESVSSSTSSACTEVTSHISQARKNWEAHKREKVGVIPDESGLYRDRIAHYRSRCQPQKRLASKATDL